MDHHANLMFWVPNFWRMFQLSSHAYQRLFDGGLGTVPKCFPRMSWMIFTTGDFQVFNMLGLLYTLVN